MTTRFHIGEFHFSAYLKSSFITKLHGEAQLDLAEMNQLLNRCIEEAQQTVKAYFRVRAAERARTVVEEWKAEKVYPYEGEAKSLLEDAERKVFDILAVTASDYMPDFVSAPPRKKAFDLRMLRTAIENSPEEASGHHERGSGVAEAKAGRTCGAAAGSFALLDHQCRQDCGRSAQVPRRTGADSLRS